MTSSAADILNGAGNSLIQYLPLADDLPALLSQVISACFIGTIGYGDRIVGTTRPKLCNSRPSRYL